MKNKLLLKISAPVVIATGGGMLPLTTTSCSVIKPEIDWFGEKSVNINGTNVDQNTITLTGYFTEDFNDPIITFLDQDGQELLENDQRLITIHEHLEVAVERTNSKEFTLNFIPLHPAITEQDDIERCINANLCKIKFYFKHKKTNIDYTFEKKVVFQTSNILDLSFSFDQTADPAEYLESIPSVEDFATQPINVLRPYSSGYSFEDVVEYGRPIFFGYKTDPVDPPEDPSDLPAYKEMLQRYVDISNIIKSDICYFTKVIIEQILTYSVPLTIKDFKATIEDFQYDMNTATILNCKVSAHADIKALSLFNGTVDINANINSPYQFFGTFRKEMQNITPYFSQLVPVLKADSEDKEQPLYDCSVDLYVAGGIVNKKYDQFFSYVGSNYFGDLGSQAALGIYIPLYWLSNLPSINLLQIADTPFSATDKFQLKNVEDLTTDNFLNVGMFKDKGFTDYDDPSGFGNSYFLEDAEHIGDNNFTCTIQNEDGTHIIPWYKVMMFYHGQNSNYIQDADGKYHIEYFLNKCFVDSNNKRTIPSEAIENLVTN